MSSEPEPADSSDDDPHVLARRALARAKDTARRRGFRTRTGRKKPPTIRTYPRRRTRPRRGDLERGPAVAMMGWRGRLTVSSVLARWEEIVGSDVAAHCQPITFTEGELTVRADSTTWATQLRYLLPQIERRLAEEVGEGMVTAIHIHGPTARTRGGKWRVSGRGPRDTWG